tara:strand:- start:308 stop:721 length:414 start_codon:yes stop_codon:yes gene_type:complete
MDKNNFDNFFSNYFSNLENNNLENSNTSHSTSNTSHSTTNNNLISHQGVLPIKHPNHNDRNILINDQLNNSKIVYNSVHLQFILYLIATCILVGIIFIINASGSLSIFIIILLLIVLFLIFKLLKFNIVNFIMNFKI